MKKVTYIISNIDRAVGFEHLHQKIKSKVELSFVILNPGASFLENYCKENKIEYSYIKYNSKRDLPMAIIKCFTFLLKTKPEIVHTHLIDASICGLLAAKLAGIKNRIHTRHHSDFHHVYHPHAVVYDKIINKLSTQIVAISDNVKSILIEKENVNPQKIVLIYHGFNLLEYKDVAQSRVNKLSEKYNASNKSPVIGVISRYTDWKGVQYIIPAFKTLLEKFPNALLILANAKGDFKPNIELLLNEIPKESYKEIEFEYDLYALYKLFDIFIHVPIDNSSEAFGQVYIEALLSKVPSIFTKSGIANEFVVNNKNAIVVPYKNTLAIYEALETLLSDKLLCEKISTNAEFDVINKFDIIVQINQLQKLYTV